LQSQQETDYPRHEKRSADGVELLEFLSYGAFGGVSLGILEEK
jgi:hypothetical protein